MSSRSSVEPVSYGGWSHNLRLSNDSHEAIVTLDVGPRVIRYGRIGGPNLLAELPEQLGKSGEPLWTIRGGHRLWTAPEDPHRSYVPDNEPVQHAVDGMHVRVSNRPDPQFQLEKSIELELAGQGSRLRLTHRVRNHGSTPQNVGAWALTVFPTGGEAFVPLAPHRPHPGSHVGRAPADFAPGQLVQLWPYYHFDDPRFSWGRSFLRVRPDPALPSAKIGLSEREGFAAYLRVGQLFTKRFAYQEGATYPDGGCNFELYTDPGILELETLGPLTTLAPKAELTHIETWSIHEVAETPTFAEANASDEQLSAFFSKIFGREPEKIS